MEKVKGVYKITNLINNKVYIGESKDIIKRWDNYRKIQCKGQTKLYHSLKYYGVKNHKFDIILKCEEKDLLYFESCFQEIYVSVENGLNCKYTGRNDIKTRHSIETIEKIKESNKNKKRSEQSKINNSNAQKKLYSEGYVNPFKNKKHSEESNQKNRESNKKLYENGYISPSCKKVINEKTNIVYNSAKEAYLVSNIKCSYSHFCRMMEGKKTNITNFKYLNNKNDKN
jgi:group I intron endonuclease